MTHPYIWLDPEPPVPDRGRGGRRGDLAETALVMVILIAGMQGIPKEYGEAAEVFGAGFFQRLRT